MNSNDNPPMMYIEVAHKDGAFFEGTRKGDICVRAGTSSQSIYFGAGSNAKPTFGINNSNLFVTNAIGVGNSVGSSNSNLESFNVNNGNALFNSNVYVMGKIGVGTTTPSEALDITTGNTKISSNLYTLGSASIGLLPAIPTETLDVASNLKVRSNAYVMRRLAVASSNPTETLDVAGNAKVLLNIYALNNLSVGGSNPREMLDVANNAIIRSNAYVMRSIGIGNSNPTEALDVVGKVKVRSDLAVMNNVGIGTSNPVEKLDLFDGNARLRSNLYVANSAGIGGNITNPTEILDVRGNTKITSNLYVFLNAAIGGGSNPSETLDVTGNIKSSSSVFVSNRLGVNTSNPIERIHVEGNILATSNIYAFSNLGVGTTLPTERIDNVGNTRLRGNVYMLSNVSVGHASPTEALDVQGNEKISSNLYVMSSIGVRTSNPLQPLHVVGNARIEGNLDVIGIYNSVSTDVKITDQFTVSNDGTGPALQVYQMGAEAIADFYDDTTLAVRIADGGAFGVNTATPIEKLHVVGKTFATQQVLASTSDSVTAPGFSFLENSNTGMFHVNTDAIGFTTGGQERIRITSTGAVGIGTNNPITAFDVVGSSLFTNTMTTYGGLTTHSNPLLVFGATTLSNTLTVAGAMTTFNGTTTFSNNVIVSGLTVMSNNLNVSGTIQGPTITSLSNFGIFNSNTSVAASNTAYNLSNFTYNAILGSLASNQVSAEFSSNTGVFGSNTAVAASNRVFRTWGVTNSNLFIGANSNLGIGTTTPEFRLDVNGQTRVGQLIVGSNSTSNAIYFGGVTGDATGALADVNSCTFIMERLYDPANGSNVSNDYSELLLAKYNDASTVTGPDRIRHIAAAHKWQVYTGSVPQNNTAVVLADSNFINAMYIDSNGSVGIGTVTPTSRLQVEGTTTLNGNVSIGTSNAISFGNATRQMINLWSTTYGIGVQNNTQYYRTAGHFGWFRGGVHSETSFDAGAGGFTDMVLSNGNLGIGTTSPTQVLDVNGAAQIQGGLICSNQIALNGTALYFRGRLTDPNYGAQYGSSFDGPLIWGLGGGALGMSFSPNSILRWRSNGVGILLPGSACNNYTLDVRGNIGLSNILSFSNMTTLAAPSLGGEGASGDRIILYTGSASVYPYSIGINSNSMWRSVPSGAIHQWFINGVAGMTLSNNLLGVGTTTPAFRLDVNGQARFVGGITACNSTIHTSNEIGLSPNAYNSMFIWDDQKPTTTLTGLLSGSATRDTSNQYIQLTPASSGQVGHVSWFLNPGNAFHLSFEYFAGNGTSGFGDGTLVSFFSTSTNTLDRLGYTIDFNEYNSGVGNDIVITTLNGIIIDSWDLGVTGYLDNTTWKKIDIQFIRGSFAISIDNGARLRTFTDSNERSIMWSTNTWFSIGAWCGAANNAHRIRNVRLSKLEQGLWSTTTMSNNDIIYPYGNVSVTAGNVGIGTTSPTYKLDVNGTINSTAIQGPTITSLSNLGLFGSNTSVAASNNTFLLSNYVYTSVSANAQATANFASNAAVFGSNTSVSASNNTFQLSNYVYTTALGGSSTAQNTANFASNAAVFGSNTSVAASNRVFQTWGVTNSNVFIGANSNLGIGTTTPAFPLDVNGVTVHRMGNALNAFTSNQILFGYQNTTSYAHSIKTRHNAGANDTNNAFDFFVWQTSDAITTVGTKHIMSITNAGVGIGTSNPVDNLHIAEPTNSNVSIRLSASNAAVHTDIGVVNNTNEFLTGTLKGDTVIKNTTGCNITFGTTSTILNVCSNANVGIGTTSPAYKLDVSGTMRATSSATFGYDLALFSNNGAWSTAAGRQLYMRYSTNGLGAEGVYIQSIDRSTSVYYNMALECSNLAVHSLGSALGTSTPNFYVQYGGNVGIGTSNPAYKLDVSGNARLNNVVVGDVGFGGTYAVFAHSNAFNVQNFALISQSNGVTYLNSALGQPIYFRHQNVDQMTLTAGNLGIGTTSPAQKLDVNGNANISGNVTLAATCNITLTSANWNGSVMFNSSLPNASNTGLFYITRGGIDVLKQQIVFHCDSAVANSGFHFATNGATSRMFIDGPTGNVGIGTASPAQRLDVNGTCRVNQLMISGNSTSNAIFFGGVTGDGTTTDPHTIIMERLYDSNNSSNPQSDVAELLLVKYNDPGPANGPDRIRHIAAAHKWQVYNTVRSGITDIAFADSNFTNAMYIDSNANVGIGTTSPAQKLDVSGNITTTGTIMLNSTDVDKIYLTNLTNGSKISHSAGWNVNYFAGPSNGNAGVHKFFVGTTSGYAERVRIEQSGNVGIGTTSPSTALDVNGVVRANRLTVSPFTQGSISVSGTGDARYRLYNNGGVVEWIFGQKSSTNHDFTLSTLVNVAEADVLTVTSGGNIGIGSTTPGSKLQVEGTTALNGNVSVSTSSSVSFGNVTRQMINLWSTTYAIGVQSSTTYFRTGVNFAWFRNGVHSDNQFDAGSGGAVDMVLNNGVLGIGTTSPNASYKLHVVGKIFASDDIIGFSDKRLKYNLNIITDALTKIHKLNGYTFDMQDSAKTRTGLIAQEVLEVLPEAVHQDENGYYSLAYGNLAGFLVEAIKEVDNKYASQIKDLQAQVNELKEQLKLVI